MRNKIEDLNLMYGVSIFNIMDKYEEFKTSNKKRIENLSNKLNDFFSWLNELDDVSSMNVVKVGSLLLEDDEIRSYFVNNEFSDKEFKDIVIYKISDIDFKKLNADILYKEENFYIEFLFDDYVLKEDKINTVDFIKDNLYSSNLLYVDLVMLLINNYNFQKRLEKMYPDNWTLNFINSLNIIFCEFDKIVDTNRDDLYYSVLHFLGYKRIKSLLYPRMLHNSFDYDQTKKEIGKYICNFVFCGLHNINKFYYIEIPEYAYNNSKKNLPSHKQKTELEFLNNIFKKFDFRQRLFIFRFSTYDNGYIYTNSDIKELEEFIFSLEKNSNFVIKSQSTVDDDKILVEDSFVFAKNYCDDNNLKVIDCSFKPNNDKNSSHNFITIVIRYNDYDYKFKLSKFNLSYTWKAYLKNDKVYKINAYLNDDFKHLVQAMLHD